MADVVSMPKLGFDMAEGTLVRWTIAEGQEVTKGAVLVEVETDKATIEVESAFSGVVLRHLVPEGEVVPVTTPIAVIGQPGEAVDYAALGLAAPEAAAAGPAPAAPASAAKQPEMALPPSTAAGNDAALPEGRLKASPLARKLAAERGIDLRRLRGSGPGGRIVRSDLDKAAIQPAEQAVTTPAAEAPSARQETAGSVFLPAPQAALGESRPDASIPLSRLRQAIGRRLTESTQQAPHFYVTHEFKMDALMALRKQVNALLPDAEKISVNDFIVRAVALALRSFPNLNASLDLAGGQIVQHGQVNVGVAVAVEGGLLTVVCQQAGLKSLRQVAGEVRSLVERARTGKIKPEDVEGSTFSISNLGMFDVEQFTAIINPPEAAILAVGSVREVPVVVDGALAIGQRMKATLSVDHRISDGAEAARFLQHLAQYLEEPLRLLV